MNLVFLFLVLTFIIGISINSLGIVDIILFCFSTILTLNTLKRVTLWGNFCKYIVFGVFIISVVIMPSWHMVSRHLDIGMITQMEINRVLSFGTRVYIVAICALMFSNKAVKKTINQTSFDVNVISDRTISWLFIILFPLSLFCLALGIGRMGAEGVELPFHLSGIINMFRRGFVPGFAAVYVENKLYSGSVIKKSYVILFFAWTLLEMLAWLSKSVVVDDFLPLMIVVLMYYRPRLKLIVKTTFPLVVVFLFMYPIVGVMRKDTRDTDASIIERISAAKNLLDQEKSPEGNLFTEPLNRMFMAPSLYIKDYNYFSGSDFFDFSRLPMLAAYGGTPAFQTRVIDGYPEWAHHSSGTAGLIDPLMHGGYGLCYIMVFVLLLLAGYVDRLASQRKYSAFAIFTLLLWRYSAFANISAAYGVLGIIQLASKLVPVFLAYRFNYNKRILAK